MKIIHCADLHLDSKMQTNLDAKKAKERKAELLGTFRRMVSYAAMNQVAAILIAGDLFDTKRVSRTAGNVVYQEIAAHPEIEFYYLKGNHDADSFLDSLDVLPPNLKLFTEEWTSYDLAGSSGVTVTGAELTAENAGIIFHSLALDMNRINIVLLHGQEMNYAGKDRTECINLPELRDKGIDYLALGHIHAYKSGKLDSRGKYCYPGCLEGRGFDECGEHGFVLLDIDEEDKTINMSFLPFAARTLFTVEADIAGCMTSMDVENAIRTVLDESGAKEKDLVKIVLTGNVDMECEKDIDYLVKQLEPEYYFVKIYDESKPAVDYEAFRLDASLKGEFVRCVMEDNELPPDLKNEIIRCGIQKLSGEVAGK